MQAAADAAPTRGTSPSRGGQPASSDQLVDAGTTEAVAATAAAAVAVTPATEAPAAAAPAAAAAVEADPWDEPATAAPAAVAATPAQPAAPRRASRRTRGTNRPLQPRPRPPPLPPSRQTRGTNRPPPQPPRAVPAADEADPWDEPTATVTPEAQTETARHQHPSTTASTPGTNPHRRSGRLSREPAGEPAPTVRTPQPVSRATAGRRADRAWRRQSTRSRRRRRRPLGRTRIRQAPAGRHQPAEREPRPSAEQTDPWATGIRARAVARQRRPLGRTRTRRVRDASAAEPATAVAPSRPTWHRHPPQPSTTASTPDEPAPTGPDASAAEPATDVAEQTQPAAAPVPAPEPEPKGAATEFTGDPALLDEPDPWD